MAHGVRPCPLPCAKTSLGATVNGGRSGKVEAHKRKDKVTAQVRPFIPDPPAFTDRL